MAYFANGTEGEIYESKYCENCVHDDTMNDKFCPILLLHMDWNYEQFSAERKEQILNLFIPRDDNGLNGNGECVFFTEEMEK